MNKTIMVETNVISFYDEDNCSTRPRHEIKKHKVECPFYNRRKNVFQSSYPFVGWLKIDLEYEVPVQIAGTNRISAQ